MDNHESENFDSLPHFQEERKVHVFMIIKHLKTHADTDRQPVGTLQWIDISY